MDRTIEFPLYLRHTASLDELIALSGDEDENELTAEALRYYMLHVDTREKSDQSLAVYKQDGTRFYIDDCITSRHRSIGWASLSLPDSFENIDEDLQEELLMRAVVLYEQIRKAESEGFTLGIYHGDTDKIEPINPNSTPDEVSVFPHYPGRYLH